ncbi:ribosomal protein L7/L12 [Streptacidiphilus sp. ASG 303]|uniref:ribosomal protein L7/L12 n=1 Tax=Streptacidiphilus sp. ASG 303 TaxID=2896847 RepID=UPI001E47036F|nr:ribosomal protein L7/L12 [Streptacidiphilus sp. ASG 303]MCD0481610.1 ribosomal protein L7/L12 [Streptacidiphilus sp. ASG 303]
MTVYFTLVCDDPPYGVVLTDPGPRPVEVVKALHRRTGLSLWRSKVLIGDLPATVLADVPEQDAVAMAAALREAGARADAVRMPPLRP